MSDDLTAILQSQANIIADLQARLTVLETRTRQTGAEDRAAPVSWGWCSPTTPPGNFLKIEKGLYFHEYHQNGWIQYYPTLFVDTLLDVQAASSNFTNPDYYRWVVVYHDSQGFVVYEDNEEYETFEECQEWFIHAINGTDLYALFSACFPTTTLAIRNDSSGGVSAIQPITLHDRTQSSFLIRDFRPWFRARMDAFIG